MAFRMALRGEQELRRWFRSTQAKMRREIKPVVKAAADPVAASARATSAFRDRSGRLRRSIKVRLQASKRNLVKFKVATDPKIAPHGHLVEKGHVLVMKTVNGLKTIGHVAPRPFMRPAIESNESRGEAIIRDGVKRILGL